MRTFQHGQHLMVCDRCGGTYYNTQIKREWTGLEVCHGKGTRGCWEPRHPVDYLRTKPDDQTAFPVRPRNFVTSGLYVVQDYWTINYETE